MPGLLTVAKVTITPAATFGILASGNESFCGTADPSNITFASTPSGGSNNFTYQWYYQDGLITCPSGSSTTGWTIINGATVSSYDAPGGLTQSRTYACLVTATAGNGCTASTAWATQCRQVTIAPTATFGTLASNNETICTGGDPVVIPFAITPSGGSGNYTYQWYYQDGLISCPSGSSTSGWTIISGAVSSSYDPPTGLTQNRTYACLVTATAGNGCAATTGWATLCRQITITTNPTINYGELTLANESFCNTGDPANITFATTPSGGGGTFTYQWYYQDGLVTCPSGTSISGWTIISGATSSNYDAPSGLTQSRTYACFVSTNTACASGSSWAAQCRQVTIGVLPPVNYGTLVTAAETYCNGGDPTNIVFSTAPSGGSGIQTYQWYYQDGLIICPSGSSTAGWTIISGATAPSYDPTSITASRTYACLVTDAGNGICPVTSNWAANCRQVTVNAVSYGTIANASETICINGDPAAISFGTAPSGGGAITYQWYYRNGTQVCPTGTSIFGMVLIAGATSATYDPPAGLNQTRTYACMVNIAAGNGCLASNNWAANCRIVNVTPLPTYGTLYPSTKRICKGGNPDPLAFQTLPSGGTTYTYQWYYKNGQSLTCPSGTNTSGWTLIPGGTTQNYDPPAGLTQTRTYACMVTSSGSGNCSNGMRWATNCVIQTVVPPPTYGTLINANESVCSGGNPALISFSTAPGGYGTKAYQWYYKDGVSGNCPTGSSTAGWSLISGATAINYDPPVGLTTSRTYACMVTASGTPCAGSQWATNCRKVTIITCREDEYVSFDNTLPQDDKTDSYNTNRPQMDGPVLEQNIPNPFTETTSITCTLNKAYNSALIRIVNVLGEELMLKKLSSPGINKIEVNRGTLTPGIYFYSLYLDGKLYDTKRMVVTY
ncbi:MAG: T9SS type A sorting domain-containing protein [Sphingobacteriales bacterium JAD_PAG50586_3]|nr:MAG: T9SS type A sorting domain-containing protein [Sphingobacteriales bacterium JAD_PAG50586_3]